MFQLKDRPRGPTEEEYALVKSVFEKTKILTVKDAVTSKWVKKQERCGGVAWQAPFQNVPEYGATVREMPTGGDPNAQAATETYLVRATYFFFVGTKNLPNGIAVGGFEVWRQDKFFEDTNNFSCTDFRRDIWTEEMDVLGAFAKGTVWVTDEMWAQATEEAKTRRDHKLVTQQDPTGALVKAMAEAMAQANSRGLPDDVKAEIEKLRAENARLLAGAKK